MELNTWVANLFRIEFGYHSEVKQNERSSLREDKMPKFHNASFCGRDHIHLVHSSYRCSTRQQHYWFPKSAELRGLIRFEPIGFTLGGDLLV